MVQTPHLSRTWLLILLVFLSVAGSVSADSPEDYPVPGTPPRADAPVAEAPVARPAARPIAAVSRLYLPMMYSPLPWVDTANRSASQRAYLEEYLASENVAHGWNGDLESCTVGSTSAAFRGAVLRRLNYFRAMAGVPAVALDPGYTQEAQAAALMMSRNKALSHAPPTSWSCYSAEGANAAGRSDLFLGMYGPSAISGYVRDPGTYNLAAGHRRWILYPPTRFMGTGDVPPVNGYPAANALWVIDGQASPYRPSTREAFVAWPPPGYVPYQVIYPRWSFSYAGADFASAGVTLACSGRALAVEVAPPEYGYGEATLVWRLIGMDDWANWPKPTADQVCSVSVKGVRINGEPLDFAYQVTIFEP